jgi:hypothetical protein
VVGATLNARFPINLQARCRGELDHADLRNHRVARTPEHPEHQAVALEHLTREGGYSHDPCSASPTIEKQRVRAGVVVVVSDHSTPPSRGRPKLASNRARPEQLVTASWLATNPRTAGPLKRDNDRGGDM